MVLGEGLTLALTGILAGLASAGALTRLLTKLLYGVTTVDAVTFAAAAVLLLFVALIAGTLPAWRATKIDPLTALRVE